MFNLRDTRYKYVPNFMNSQTALTVLSRIEEYLEKTGKTSFTITLHGGEPTLWPIRNFQQFFSEIDRITKRGLIINVSIQTNAYKPIPDKLLKIFESHNVTLGISLDGPKTINDRFRITKKEKGSYDRVIANIKGISDKGFHHLIGGFLSVAQPDINPSEYFEWLTTLPVKRVDVLWPIDYNYDHPPWGDTPTPNDKYLQAPSYGVWFAKLFDEWWEKDDPNTHIRLFYNTVQLLLGGTSHIDALVNDAIDMFRVNTDGHVEYPDYIRTASSNSATSPFHISRDAIIDYSSDPLFNQLLHLRDSLPLKCRHCNHREICGGGFLPGRTSKSQILNQESILCSDQMYYFSHVKTRIRNRLFSKNFVKENMQYTNEVVLA